MAKWVKSKTYREDRVEKQGVVCALEFVEKLHKGWGTFNLYKVIPLWGEPYMGIIFDNQPNLLGYAGKNKDNLFAIRHMESDSSIHEYTVYSELLDSKVTAKTIAHLCVVARKPVPAEEV